MSNPQEIIVYRSPLEHAFWSSEILVPIIVIGVLFIVFVLVNELWIRKLMFYFMRRTKNRYPRVVKYVHVYLPLVLAAFFTYLFIKFFL